MIPYFSLASGFLSGKYRSGEPMPKTARAAGVEKTYMNERGFRVLAAVEKVAAAVNATPAQVSLSWLAHRPGITAPIASATSAVQVKELAGASSCARRGAAAWIRRAPGVTPSVDLRGLRPCESGGRPLLRRLRRVP